MRKYSVLNALKCKHMLIRYIYIIKINARHLYDSTKVFCRASRLYVDALRLLRVYSPLSGEYSQRISLSGPKHIYSMSLYIQSNEMILLTTGVIKELLMQPKFH